MRFLVLTLVDLLLAGVRWCVLQALAGKAAMQRLWDNAGTWEWLLGALDSLLASFRTLELYLDQVRTRMRYRVFFDQLTAPMSERYRNLRRG